MTESEQADLQRAVDLLENPGFIIRLTSLLGAPIEKALQKLPAKASEAIQQAVQKSLEVALQAAVSSLGAGRAQASPRLHKTAVLVSGLLGGTFGLPGAAAELPVTTGIMLRSIADIARAEGEDLGDLRARLACLEVLALGGGGRSEGGKEVTYYAVRLALAREIGKAAEYIFAKGLTETEGPILVRGMATLITRFGIQVEEKLLAESAPLLGGLTGAAINFAFLDHFQDMATGHFIIRRLERLYGQEAIRKAYEEALQRHRGEAWAACDPSDIVADIPNPLPEMGEAPNRGFRCGKHIVSAHASLETTLTVGGQPGPEGGQADPHFPVSGVPVWLGGGVAERGGHKGGY